MRLTRHEAREIEAGIDQEFGFHLEMRTEQLIRQGYSPQDARAEALRRFGDAASARAACVESDRRWQRAHKRRELLLGLASDALFALRRMRRRPLAFAVIILTLGVGIGATTAVFSATHHVLWGPLPIADEERAVAVWETDPDRGESVLEVATGNFTMWQRLQRSFAAMGLAVPFGFDLDAGGRPQPVTAWLVTAGFLDALGASPALGRLFAPEEFGTSAPPVVILSHGFWRDRFAADPSIVGRSIRLDGTPTRVVGVLPEGLEYPRRAADVWAPTMLGEREQNDHSSRYSQVVARLGPGVSRAAASADMDRVARLVAAEVGPSASTGGIRVQPLREHVFGPVRPALLALLGAVGFLLLIGCSNVANLLLSDTVARERELALRAAVGATGARIAAQLFAECAVYAAFSGVLGVLLAAWGIDALVAFGPANFPRLASVALDWQAFGFAAAIALASALLVGVAPALRASRTEVASLLRSGEAVTPHRRLRSAFVSIEVALALVLMIGAGLLGRSFAALRGNDLGFAPVGVAELQMFLYDTNKTPEARRARVAEYVAAFEAMPGVERVGVVTALPFHPSQIDADDDLTVEGSLAPPRRVHTTVASPGYFDTMRVPIQRGRGFDDRRDHERGPRVALVNDALARSLFPGQDPIGKRVRVGVMDRPQVREIVGVVGDVRPKSLDSEPRPEIYVPMLQSGTGSVTFVVRTRGDPHQALLMLGERVAALDPGQAVYHAAVVEDLVDATLVERRFNLLIAATLSTVALFLAVIGVYGLMSFETTSRTRELGIRAAIGASPRRIAAMVLGHGLRTVMPGVVLGLLGAAILMHAIRSLLYRVEPVDPLTFFYIGAGTLAVVALAAYLPARRASAVHPMEAMRRP
ncbi:MAG TPA: ABC transporter permease [Kofleriaceae bacterium]|nr:ABC transporter permease [Kofleriaceae bacterium]